MIHYTCDRCKRQIDTADQTRYVVQIDIQSSAEEPCYSLEDDIDQAKQIMLTVCQNDPNVLEDPETFVGVLEHADSSVNLVCRPWTDQEKYWDVYFAVTESVKKAFDVAGVTIPFPQRDVHLLQQSA